MKGIVLECDADRCVILKDDGGFVNVKNKSYTVGQQVYIPAVSVAQKITAACLLVTCLGVWSWFLPSSYIYMDINPSVRLGVNSFGRVVSTVAMNEDGKALLAKTETPMGQVADCMEHIVQQCYDQGYITADGADMEIYVCTDQQTLENTVQTAAQELEQASVTVSVYTISREENKSAMKHHISARRLQALKHYTHYAGGTLEENKEKFKGVTTDEILEQVRQYRSGDKAGITQGEETVSYVSEKRRKAVAEYTACFGGLLEENHRLLRGISTQEIYQLIRERKGT